MSKTADAAFDRALVKINAMSDAIEAREAKHAADARLHGLMGHLIILQPSMIDGFAGGMVVFNDVFSSNHKRRARVRKLIAARKCQLNGQYHWALTYLRDAAAIRCTERLYLSCETMQAEHDEGRIGDTPIFIARAPDNRLQAVG